MTDDKRTVEASNEHLRQLLIRIHSTLTYGSSIATLVLALGWLYVGLDEDLTVSPLLPILAIASGLFAVGAWINQEEVQLIGKPYQTEVEGL